MYHYVVLHWVRANRFIVHIFLAANEYRVLVGAYVEINKSRFSKKLNKFSSASVVGFEETKWKLFRQCAKFS